MTSSQKKKKKSVKISHPVELVSLTFNLIAAPTVQESEFQLVYWVDLDHFTGFSQLSFPWCVWHWQPQCQTWQNSVTLTSRPWGDACIYWTGSIWLFILCLALKYWNSVFDWIKTLYIYFCKIKACVGLIGLMLPRFLSPKASSGFIAGQDGMRMTWQESGGSGVTRSGLGSGTGVLFHLRRQEKGLVTHCHEITALNHNLHLSVVPLRGAAAAWRSILSFPPLEDRDAQLNVLLSPLKVFAERFFLKKVHRDAVVCQGFFSIHLNVFWIWIFQSFY